MELLWALRQKALGGLQQWQALSGWMVLAAVGAARSGSLAPSSSQHSRDATYGSKDPPWESIRDQIVACRQLVPDALLRWIFGVCAAWLCRPIAAVASTTVGLLHVA